MRRLFMRPDALILPIVLGLAGAVSAAQVLRLEPPAAGDLAVATLSAPTGPESLFNTNREPVRFAWAVAGSEPLAGAEAPFAAVSRSYILEVDATEFRDGVEIPVTAPGAVVRVSPRGDIGTGTAMAVDPHYLEVVRPNGVAIRGERAIRQIADPDQLRAAGAPFPAGTAAFRLKPEAGFGRLVLRAADLPHADDSRFLVQVVEPASPVTLSLEAERASYLAGEQLRAHARLTSNDRSLEVDEASAVLVAPDGRTSPVQLRRDASSGSLTLGGPVPPPADQGLWELHATVVGHEGDLEVRRDVHTAFAVTRPTARLDGDALLLEGPGLRLQVDVEAAAPGRYAVHGVILGTDRDGSKRPAAVAESAAWLEPGVSGIVLEVGADLLHESGLRPPYEVRDLRLVDQSRMGALHRQAKALVIP